MLKQLEESTRYHFRKLQNEMRRLAENYIPWNEFVVLQLIEQKGPLMASEIANQIEVTSSHITTVTDKLIKKGLIQRERSDADRRIVYLQVTEQGREIAHTMETMRTNYYQQKFKQLTNEEMESLIQLFGKFT